MWGKKRTPELPDSHLSSCALLTETPGAGWKGVILALKSVTFETLTYPSGDVKWAPDMSLEPEGEF